MLKREVIRTNIIQIYSLTVKDLKLKTRYKSEFLVEYVAPLLSMFFPYIIFNTLFSIGDDIFETYYSSENFLLFILLGYCTSSLIFLLWNYKDLFYDEKTWKTLNAVFVAPVSKFNILIGYFLSGLISKSLPIIFIIAVCYFLYPIPFISLILVILVLFCISITFAGMGFILGLFEIVNEDISASLAVGISVISLVSCVFYPIEIFPESVRFIIKINPLYYYMDLLRLSWWAGINSEDALSYITIYHILIVGIFTIITPVLASFLFIKIYNKYGTSGY